MNGLQRGLRSPPGSRAGIDGVGRPSAGGRVPGSRRVATGEAGAEEVAGGDRPPDLDRRRGAARAIARIVALFLVVAGAVPGCVSDRGLGPRHRPAGSPTADGAGPRPVPAARGRILVGGAAVPVSVPVVGPQDPGGFDGTRESCWFTPERVLPAAPAPDCDTPRRYGVRSTAGLPASTAARVAASGWDRAAVLERVDQIVLHYDVAITSSRCFEVLHDERGLSIHFLLDVDGTVRQTLDLAHRARHAGPANDRSVGIEIAHVGAYDREAAFARLYERDAAGLLLRVPASLRPPTGGPFRVARPEFVRGDVHGVPLVQADYTTAQYESLRQLLAALAEVLPATRTDGALAAPRGPDGAVRRDALTDEERARFRGVLGHWHVTAAKQDPGPALDWERILPVPTEPTGISSSGDASRRP